MEYNFTGATFLGVVDSVSGVGTLLYIKGNNIKIKGGIIKPRNYWGTHEGSGGDNGLSVNGTNVIVDSVTVDMTEGGFRGIDIQGGEGEVYKNIKIVNCTIKGGENGIDILPNPGDFAEDITISDCYIEGTYQGILINPGYGILDEEGERHGVYSKNININNVIIDSPQYRGLDLRYVRGLNVSNVQIINVLGEGMRVYSSLGVFSNISIYSAETPTNNHEGINFREDFEASGYEEIKDFSLFQNIVILGNFTYSINNRCNNVIYNLIFISGYSELGILNNNKNAIYSNITYDSNLELTDYNNSAKFINILKADNSISYVRTIDEIPYEIGLKFNTFDSDSNNKNRNFKFAYKNGILSLLKSTTFGGEATEAILQFLSNGEIVADKYRFKSLTAGTIGPQESIPSNPIQAQLYYNNTLKQYTCYNGQNWVNLDGTPITKSGESSDRPTGAPVGFIYFDTTLGKSIVYNGTAWVNIDGTALE